MTPANVVAIEAESDIVRVMRQASESGRTVRAVGAMGSKNGCWSSDGVVLDLNGYAAVVAFDGDSVTVQAGMRIGRLNQFLRARGKIIPTCGEWQGATVGGATSTGSHGGSTHHGISSSSILSMRLVTATGDVVDIDRRHPHFNHAAVSMGLLGVISTITMACEDAFHLELETRVLRFGDYLARHEQLHRGSEFFAAVWFPSARRVLTFCADRTAPGRCTGPRVERFSVTTILLDAASRYLEIHGVSDRLLSGRFVDHGDRILCPIVRGARPVRTNGVASPGVREMEMAVPLASAGAALDSLDRLLQAHRYARLNAVGLRPSRADAFSLSPCHERDTLWAGLFYHGRSPVFARELASTAEELQGRCHWGKHVGLSAQHFAAHYPKLTEFCRVKQDLDPTGMFGNQFTRSLGL